MDHQDSVVQIPNWCGISSGSWNISISNSFNHSVTCNVTPNLIPNALLARPTALPAVQLLLSLSQTGRHSKVGHPVRCPCTESDQQCAIMLSRRVFSHKSKNSIERTCLRFPDTITLHLRRRGLSSLKRRLTSFFFFALLSLSKPGPEIFSSTAKP